MNEDSVRTPNGGLFGNSKRKLKHKKQSGTPGANRGRAAQVVSYCPVCPVSSAKPEDTPRAAVSRETKIGRCKFNHYWLVGGDSLPIGTSRILEVS